MPVLHARYYFCLDMTYVVRAWKTKFVSVRKFCHLKHIKSISFFFSLFFFLLNQLGFVTQIYNTPSRQICSLCHLGIEMSTHDGFPCQHLENGIHLCLYSCHWTCLFCMVTRHYFKTYLDLMIVFALSFRSKQVWHRMCVSSELCTLWHLRITVNGDMFDRP